MIYQTKAMDRLWRGKKKLLERDKEQLILKIDFYTIRVIEKLGTAYKKNLAWERTGYLQ